MPPWTIEIHRALREEAFGMFVRLSVVLMVAWFGVVSQPARTAADEIPAPKNTQAITTPLLSPQEALARMKVPEGFRVELFAHEPDVQQPISITTDERGRLWVAECYTYAENKVNFDPTQKDRIVVLEDSDGDGKADKRTVFASGLDKLTSVEVGFGGVWALAAPHLLFYPDRDRDDKPDGPPVVLLDGWDAGPVRHNIVNGLKWGPDGWLYGRHGILATSVVGAPGASESQRTKINCGIWRYHPTRKKFEAVAHGTTNPWGFDFDQHGEMFMINTVIGHLWHVVPGAHYRRMYGTHFNPYLFGVIEQTADHFHWDTQESWSDIRKLGVTDTTSAAGGGHAHSGLLIYQGDHWPEHYRGKVFTVNLHGQRLNCDRLERHLAGYTARHEPDFLFSGDPWFRAIDLISGPDDGVYLADWSDIGECHENDGVHRTSGRIYKISHGAGLKPKASLELSAADDQRLVEALRQPRDWIARNARRLLQERAAEGRDMTAAREALFALFADGGDGNARDQRIVAPKDVVRVRAMLCLAAMDALDDGWLVNQLGDQDEHVRKWAVRLLADEDFLAKNAANAARITAALKQLAAKESSGLVQLYLASALNRMPLPDRWEIAESLASSDRFEQDNMLPLMIWYGLEPAVPREPLKAVRLVERANIELVRQFTARRLALEWDRQPHAVEALLALAARAQDERIRHDILRGLSDALRGWTKVTPPHGWNKVAELAAQSRSPEVRSLARDLSVVFGDGRAINELQALVMNDKADVSAREQALRTLLTAKPDDLVPLLHKLVDDRELMVEAIRGLATVDHPATPQRVLDKWPRLPPEGRAVAISTLVSRPNYAKALLAAVAANQIPRREISAFHARQILSFHDDALTEQLTKVWGEVRVTSAEKQQLATKWKLTLTPERLQTAKLSEGRALFAKTCANCHVLFGSGKPVGPDLTGGNRRNLDYLLENILDPSATVAADFRMTVFEMKDGRVINGVAVEQTEKTLTIQTQNDRVTIQRADIAEQQVSNLSVMPDGLLQNLSEDQVRDLIGYLMSPEQVPLPGP
jgi:putative membrane-bound dehydrogenase-like protein